MKILIVDDDEFSRVVLTDVFKEFGHCDTVCNGYEAIDFFMRSHAEGVPYDLICLDIIMPGIDGIQVLKQIRTIEEQESINFPESVQVIIISSMSDLEHIMVTFDSRCETYMIKPLDQKQLRDHLSVFGFSV